MHRPFIRRVAPAATALVIAAAGLALPLAPGAQATSTFAFSGPGAGRFAGANRFDTARLIAASAGFGQVDNVVLATGRNYPDALAGNYLAAAYGSPILLTERTSVPTETVSALSTLKAKTVTLLGGTAAIDTAVENDLRGRGYTVDRVQGLDRYGTALAVARKSQPLAGVGTTTGGKKTAFLTTGQNFADALAAGPVAWAKKLPVFLTTSSSLSPDASTGLKELGIERVVILGGTGAVSTAVETQVKTDLPSATVERVFGVDRTATATQLATWALTNAGFVDTHVNLARGDDFADALAGGPHGGRESAPTLLTFSPTALDTSANANATYLGQHEPTLQTGHIFGGTGAVSDAVANAAAAAAGQAPPEANAGTATPQVRRVVAAEDYFVGTNGRSYFYDATDSFTLKSKTLSLAQFESFLNPDDVLTVNYQPSGTSTFDLSGNVTHAPSVVSVVAGNFDSGTVNNDVRITFQIPANNAPSTAYTVNRYKYPFTQCGVGTPAADSTGTVTTTTGTVTQFNLDSGCYQYEVVAAEVNGAITGASATSPRSADVKVPSPSPTTITHAYTTTPAAPASGKTLAKGDVHVFYFADAMATSIAASGSRYRVSDPDGTELYITCGTANTTCTYQDTFEQPDPNSAPVQVHKLTVTLGDVPAPLLAGTVTGAQYPLTIREVSSQWQTAPSLTGGGGGVDLSNSDRQIGAASNDFNQ
jgi:putative cell wall-binding protein